MADNNQNKYSAPSGPPPNYPMSPPPAQQHYDAGPVGQYDQRGFVPQGQYGPPQGQYGPPQGYDQYGNPYQNQYGPPQGYYGQQPGMQYQQPGMPPQQGYYVDNRGRSSGADGCCAAFLGALACCCCLDILF